MTTAQTVSRIPGGMQTFKYVLRQNPPAPVSFTATANTQTFTFLGIPALYVVTSVRVDLITTFSAFGLSAAAVTIGASDPVASTSNANYYAPALQLLQAPSKTSFMYWSPFTAYTTNAHDITATFTTTGAQLAALTAGEVEITILYRPL